MVNSLFMKYPSLTQNYNVIKSRNLSAELSTDNLWYATEKVDGTNISIHVNLETQEYVLAGRNGIIKPETDEGKMYTGLDNFLSKEFVHDLIARAKDIYMPFDTHSGLIPFLPKVVHLWGEYYGSRIQKHDYDIAKEHKRDVVLFDGIVEGYDTTVPMHRMGVSELIFLIDENDGMLPKFIETEDSYIEAKPLKEWLAQEPDEKSFYGGTSEGIVLKPVRGMGYIPEVDQQNFLGVKYKTEKYLETRNIHPKIPKETKNPELVADLERYLTEARVMNVISHGDIAPEFSNFNDLRLALTADVVKEYKDDESLNKLSGEYTEEDIGYALNNSLKGPASAVIRKVLRSA